MSAFTFRETLQSDTTMNAGDFLTAKTGLSKSRVKDAMNKGAVRLLRKKKRQRLRKANTRLQKGDQLELFYDEKLLVAVPPVAICLHDLSRYSIWNKPAGLLTQGTEHGDHFSLIRQAELFFKPRRQVFPVHRLDREAFGLVLVAHDRTTAAYFSELFRNGGISKKYRVKLLGNISVRGQAGIINQPLDGKEAITEYQCTGYDPAANISIVETTIRTGRLHQIRRHFAEIGFPVMGDPRYGKGNKNTDGLQLAAFFLGFTDPDSGETVQFALKEHH